MARPLRIEMTDGVYHVTSRGLEHRAIVCDDADRVRWLDLLSRVAIRREWRVLAWALMDNHSHLFVRTPHADLSAGMHDLNSGYATGFNRRHGRVGPLFQGRFKAILVEDGYHFWELSRYIHLNPVRAGLARDPETHRWSSCAGYFRRSAAPPWLAWEEVLCEHGRTVRAARRAYREFLREGIAGRLESPLKGAVASSLLGTERFVERMRDWLQDRLPDRDVPAARALRREVSLEAIARAVARAFGVSVDDLRQRDSKGNLPRAVAVYLTRALTRAPLAAIGRYFGGVSGSAVSHIIRAVGEQRGKRRAFDRAVGALQRGLAPDSTFKT